ncbi:MAG TPA: 3-isopropylmalate dehydrogenase [Candidatus Mediterraneibacter excrementigallinarum]|nr:3-isopropylmalate dehydrogenase [Candidatus Mediterraneibacter excrementigallinarum]
MERQLLQWHPAFCAGVQIELAEAGADLTFIREYQLGRKPKQVDLLVIKKEGTQRIRKNIGRIFRRHNIVEYKSPKDSLSVDDFYKVYGYACFYKSDVKAAESVDMEELTITFACHRYPAKLFRHLREKRKFQIRKVEEGIYYIIGDYLPIQILLLNRLPEKENLWLRNLTDHLSGEEQAERLVKEYWNHKDNTLDQAVMDIIIRANRKQFEEAKNMCDALRELFAEELKENYQAGEDQGRREFSRLILKLSELGRTDEIIKAAESPEYQEKLMKELGV